MTVNGKVVQTPDVWVDPVSDRVALDGRLLVEQQKAYILLYKPKGYITTYRDPEGRPTVYDLLKDVRNGSRLWAARSGHQRSVAADE